MGIVHGDTATWFGISDRDNHEKSFYQILF